MPAYIKLAAYNSAEEEKSAANAVCSGKNDELTIQNAISSCIKEGKNLFFFNGTYVIDSFYELADGGPKCAICFPNCKREIAVIGQNLPYSKNGGGVILYCSTAALSSLNGESADVIRTAWTNRGISSGSALKIENIRIALSHNQAPVRCIDLRRCDRPELKNVQLNAFADMDAGLGNPPSIAAKGCIGLTMTDGSNACFSNYTNVYASGFYEGIQVGGEHVVMINCGAIMCYYGHTFGNYEIHCGANHPITLINCMDERNVNLPLFNQCGDDDGSGNRMIGEQEITMISFNIERLAEQTPGKKLGDRMRELHPGSFKGSIDFTAQPAWCHLNEKDFQLWENDGSGVGFKTRNNCHKTICSTEERLSYYPMLGQQIFDTDLQKMVICIDPKNKKWVDFFGNAI